MHERRLLDEDPKPLGNLDRFFQRSFRQQTGELFAAIAHRHIQLAEILPHQRAQLPQNGVASRMPPGIVNFLEMVDVHHHQAEWSVITPAAIDLPFH